MCTALLHNVTYWCMKFEATSCNTLEVMPQTRFCDEDFVTQGPTDKKKLRLWGYKKCLLLAFHFLLFQHLQTTKKKCNLKTEVLFGMGRKHRGKRRKCWLPAFSPFSTFSKGFFFRVVKSPNCVVELKVHSAWSEFKVMLAQQVLGQPFSLVW